MNALVELLQSGIGVVVILVAFVMVADWKGLTSRVLDFQHSFLTVFGWSETDTEDFVDRMLILARVIGVMLLAGGIYVVVIALCTALEHYA